MPVFDRADVVHDRLADLADALELEKADPIDMLICGGAALAVMGFVVRATDDYPGASSAGRAKKSTVIS